MAEPNAAAAGAKGSKKKKTQTLSQSTGDGGGSKAAKGRGHWDNEIEFFLATMGFAIGLGNLWRFPYLCYRFGGGAFLLPYAIALFAIGLPAFYVELALGQYAAKGPVHLFANMCPLFAGVGWSMIWISYTVSVYYNVIIAWVLIYWGLSWDFAGLWWLHCDNKWNTHNCISSNEDRRCSHELFGEQVDKAAFWYDGRCHTAQFCPPGLRSGAGCISIWQYSTLSSLRAVRHNGSLPNWANGSVYAELESAWHLYYEKRMDGNVTVPSSPAEEFFRNWLYDMVSMGGSPGTGHLLWRLVIALGVAWIGVFLCLMFGVKSVGKVVYVTALLPFVVLLIMLVRGATLDNAGEGVLFYITPDISALSAAGVWQEAAMQICYSLGPGFGTLPTMSSYNHMHNNVWRDALLVAAINCCTSLLGGLAVFSVLGYLKHTLGDNVPMDKVVKQGHSLTFVTYPEAIGQMPWANLWAILFFTMLLTLGLDSQFAMVETVTTAIMDQFPRLVHYKPAVVAATCLSMFLLALPQCTQGGLYHFAVWLNYSAWWGLLIVLFVEMCVIAHIYGIGRLVTSIGAMWGNRKMPSWVRLTVGPVGWYWRATWLVTTPLCLLSIMLWNFVKYAPISESGHVLNGWWEACGIAMAIMPAVLIVAFAIVAVVTRDKAAGWSALWRPSAKFGRKAHRRRHKRGDKSQRAAAVSAAVDDSTQREREQQRSVQRSSSSEEAMAVTPVPPVAPVDNASERRATSQSSASPWDERTQSGSALLPLAAATPTAAIADQSPRADATQRHGNDASSRRQM